MMNNIRVNESTTQQRMQNIIREQEYLWLLSSNNQRSDAVLPNDIENQDLDNTEAVLLDSNMDGELHNINVVLPDSNMDGETDITDAERLENDIVEQILLVVPRKDNENHI